MLVDVVLGDADDDVEVALLALAGGGDLGAAGGSPSPWTRTAWPSEMPGGILMVSLRCLGCRPLPRQASQRSLTVVPRPWQLGQVVTMRNMPPRPVCWTLPWPPQVSHLTGLLPGLVPDPRQGSQTSERLNSMSRSQPLRTSWRETSISYSRS